MIDQLNFAIDWLDRNRSRAHAADCRSRAPDARCSCGLHRVLSNIRAVRNTLEAIPEGCTPADAKVLREANHRMAQELHEFKAAQPVALTGDEKAALDRALLRSVKIVGEAAQPVAQEPRVCWLVEEFSDSGNSTGRYMQDQNDLTITTDAQKARQFLRSRTATFRATDMREKWGTAWRPVSHVFRAAQPQQAADKIGGAA